MATETREIKRENFSSVEEALEGAGTTVLSHLGSDAKKLTREQVTQHEEELHLIGKRVLGEHRVYVGPYTDLQDERNAWTYAQEAGEVTRSEELSAKADDEDNKYDEFTPRSSY
jgi:hypothetical protein